MPETRHCFFSLYRHEVVNDDPFPFFSKEAKIFVGPNQSVKVKSFCDSARVINGVNRASVGQIFLHFSTDKLDSPRD